METLLTIEGTNISRRDFLKLKSFLMLWLTFLQSFGVDLFADSTVKK